MKVLLYTTLQWWSILFLLCLCYSVNSAPAEVQIAPRPLSEDVVETGNFSEYKDPIMRFLYSPGLSVSEILKREASTWHWLPWKHVQYDIVVGKEEPVESECTTENSLDEMPQDLFTQEQRRNGAVILHLLGAIYFFTLLAVICNNYFLPAVECICEDLNISEDVAAATFMSIATTTPELFTNVISTFVTNSDMGVGAILGSMLFNTLGVAAVGALATVRAVKLDWFPLTRDSIIFSINLCILIAVAWDGKIMWYEATTLFCLFICYFCFVISNHRWEKFLRPYIENRFSWCRPESPDVSVVEDPEKFKNEQKPEKDEKTKPEDIEKPERHRTFSTLIIVPDGGVWAKIWWLYSWPIRMVTMCLIPHPRKYRRLYPLTFLLCIVLIGLNSYMVYWMVAIIGFTFGIPETVMGMTLLAGGGCLPEAISCVILIRRGEGGFGISNSLGANSLAILMSLGVPWFIKTMIEGASTTNAQVVIKSYGIEFTIICLLLAVLTMYVILSISRYTLRKTVGGILMVAYGVFIVLAILNEVDLIFPSGNFCK